MCPAGCRIVRIATHPELTRAGYGSRAVQQLCRYYEGHIADLAEEDAADSGYAHETALPCVHAGGELLKETLAPRAQLPPLLQVRFNKHRALIPKQLKSGSAPFDFEF